MLWRYVNKMGGATGKVVRTLWTTAGGIFLVVGLVGTLVPLLPTTPFLLLAAWCFGKGSPRFRRAMEQNRYLGPVIRDWERYRVIPLYAKALATFMLGTSSAYLALVSTAPGWGKAGAYACFAALLAYVWTKPSRRPVVEVPSRDHAPDRALPPAS